ncbi:MAG: hypothetical protein LQ347_002323 [Umbilicaria vellea]|nr:MAG: hypothetical protein LQ347_002323 [Umbilicaria vellea]
MAAEGSSFGAESIVTYSHELNEMPQEMFANHTCQDDDAPASSGGDEPPIPPPKDTPKPIAEDGDNGSYFNPMGLSRTSSTVSSEPASFTTRLSQLIALKLPDAFSLSSSISSITTAPEAAEALSGLAEQIQKWISKASEVLARLDADDDVEWAAAGGREGVEEIDSALRTFENLISVYVAAIERLQERLDISDLPAEKLTAVADQMEVTLKNWESISKLLKGVKRQVELAMEWEELWGVVLGDIGYEIESLCRMVFEMEEKRHYALAVDTSENGSGLDIHELETIVEETPTGGRSEPTNRFSLPPAFTASSPMQSSGMGHAQDDSSLLALFARMQPLRASLDFLPMTLSSFHQRAELVLPSACEELENRREGLETGWKKLECDAESLRQELADDRWVLIFRNAGRQAKKMCESIERSLSKLQESIDTGAQHYNLPAVAMKVENYEAKKLHYGSAIQRVVSIINRALQDRLTVHGDVLRLRSDTQARWKSLEAEMKDMDLALEDLNLSKSQQLRDSVSSMVSNDQSTFGSLDQTPASSPTSSVAVGPSRGIKRQPSTPGLNAASRRSSAMSSVTSRPSNEKRYSSLPIGSTGSSQIPQTASTPRSMALNVSTSQYGTPPFPSPTTSYYSATPTRGGQTQRTGMSLSDGKPRWNSSPRVDYFEFKPLSHTTPSTYRRSSLPQRSPLSSSVHSSIPLPSPLSRESFSSPASRSASQHRRPATPSATTTMALRTRRGTSPAPAQPSLGNTRVLRSKASTQFSANKVSTSQRPPAPPGSSPAPTAPDAMTEESPSSQPKSTRPATALANGRQSSMLPLRHPRARSGLDNIAQRFGA